VRGSAPWRTSGRHCAGGGWHRGDELASEGVADADADGVASRVTIWKPHVLGTNSLVERGGVNQRKKWRPAARYSQDLDTVESGVRPRLMPLKIGRGRSVAPWNLSAETARVTYSMSKPSTLNPADTVPWDGHTCPAEFATTVPRSPSSVYCLSA